MLELVDRVVLGMLVTLIMVGTAATHLSSCACSSRDDWALEREAHAESLRIEHQEFVERFRQDEDAREREFNAMMNESPTPPVDPYDLLDERHKILVDNILDLAPHASQTRAMRISKLIIEHSDFSNIPHENFVAAIIQRESHYSKRVENGIKRGALGEIGMMQVMPDGYAIRRFGNDCEQTDAACNIMTGTRYLENARELCETDDPWVWMAAYGVGECPSPRTARRLKTAKNARIIFCDITPECEEHWPL
jgi:hypothetical protein